MSSTVKACLFTSQEHDASFFVVEADARLAIVDDANDGPLIKKLFAFSDHEFLSLNRIPSFSIPSLSQSNYYLNPKMCNIHVASARC